MFDWYSIFNLTDFLDTGLISKTYTLLLEDLGEKSFLITRGNVTSVVFEDQILPLQFNDNNPYQREAYAVYVDSDNNVWFGFGVEE